MWHELEVHAGDYRTVPGAVIVMGTVSGNDGNQRIGRRVIWTWKLRDARAVLVRVSDLGPS